MWLLEIKQKAFLHIVVFACDMICAINKNVYNHHFKTKHWPTIQPGKYRKDVSSALYSSACTKSCAWTIMDFTRDYAQEFTENKGMWVLIEGKSTSFIFDVSILIFVTVNLLYYLGQNLTNAPVLIVQYLALLISWLYHVSDRYVGFLIW